ncbi:MAG: class I SAM-dependent methyltransferase [Candidatus Solibacter usitatus]|nr:class I SAM-dependent methyltransferase [Candidatus Solibacter usitatus]
MPRIDSPFPSKPISWPQIYLGVALTTLATLILELSLTRIFSVVFHYHFAFLAISIALFGLGAGGVLSYWLKSKSSKLFSRIGILSTVNAILVPGSLLFLLTRDSEFDTLLLAIVYFTSAIPFIASGAVVATVIAETIERVDRVYFFDLLGAAGGCLLLVPFLNYLGGPNAVIATGVLYAVAGAIWFHVEGRIQGRAAAVLIALALTALVVLNIKKPVVEVQFAKGQRLPAEAFTKWNLFSRIGVQDDKNLIVIDADASTGIPTMDLDHMQPADRKNLMTEGPSLPYWIKPGAKTLVIGSGGGYDVARAIASGSKDVTAVEINPIIANTVMRDKFAGKSRRIYFRPEVRVFVEDGRSFARRSGEKYQVIQATLVDTWASTAAGAFALTENNLYTSEAFHDYLSHLTDDGILAFTRWGFEPPRESLRLLALAREALLQLGEKNPALHVVIGRERANLLQGWGATDTVIITRKPITAAQIPTLKAALADAALTALYYPGILDSTAFSQYLSAPDPASFYAGYRYNVTPVSDDRPFFFFTVQPRDVLQFFGTAYRESADYKINKAVPLLFGLVGISILAMVITLALPPLLLGTRLPAEKGVRRYLLYFAAIGTGYILVQVALIQKFVLFLGHPTYALTVIIFSMLLSSGIGSGLSGRFLRNTTKSWMRTLAIIAALVAVLALVAGPITRMGVGLPLWVKMSIAIVMIAPAGFFMGMPFPAGLAYLERRHSPSVRWAWSLNAASSVTGSAFAMVLALYLGLQATLLIGGLCYLLALFVIRLEQPTLASGGPAQ